MIADWAMSTCDDCRVIVTANTESQLVTKTWPEVTKWFRRSINSHWWSVAATRICAKEKGHENNWRLDRETWSENNTEAFAGLHNRGKRIVVIYDEASAIPSRIWEVTEGALTDENTEIIWIAFGNPTQNTGRFKECFGFRSHRWVHKQIDSRTVDGTNKEQIAKWIADYGEDSDFCRVRVKGEFPRAGSAQFISSEIVGLCRKRMALEAEYASHWPILSVDPARFGDNRSMIGKRQGIKATILDTLRGIDTVQLAMRVIYHIKREKPRAVIVDGDGVGAGVIDALHEHRVDSGKAEAPDRFGDVNTLIMEFHGAATPRDPVMYFNARAESWGSLRDWLKAGADIPDDPDVETDLTGPEYFFSSKNQIQLERKEDMKKRGLASPDIGDMLAMSFAAWTPGWSDEEKLRIRLASIEDPFWRHVQQVKATLDHEREEEYDERPEWMRNG